MIFLDVYVSDKRVSKYMSQKPIEYCKKKKDESTIIIGEFNTPLLEMDRFLIEIRMDLVELNKNINQLNIIGI